MKSLSENGRLFNFNLMNQRDTLEKMLGKINHAVELPLSEKDIQRGVKRKYFPASDIIRDLEKLKNAELWKFPRAGGQDQYAGLPPAIRLVDELIKKLQEGR